MTNNNTKIDLGHIGIFTGAFETQRASVVREGIAELDARGWPTLWIGESVNREVFANAMLLLDASKNIRIASGIANTQVRAALSMNSGWMAVSEAHAQTGAELGAAELGDRDAHVTLAETIAARDADGAYRQAHDMLSHIVNALGIPGVK